MRDNNLLKVKQTGLTLIELMVSIVVLAVLLAAAAPSFNDFFVKGRLRGAADSVSSLLSKARAEAGRSDRDVTAVLRTNANNWCIGARQRTQATAGISSAAGSETCDCLATPNQCVVGNQVVLVSAADFSDITISASNNANFQFDRKLGVLSNLAAGSMTLSTASDRFQLRVEVAPSGYPRVCVPAGKPQFGGFDTCA